MSKKFQLANLWEIATQEGITGVVIERTKHYIELYNGKTDEIIFSESLLALREMFEITIDFYGENSYSSNLILWKDLCKRIETIEKILAKTQKRVMKQNLTQDDEKNIIEIKKLLKTISIIKGRLSFKNIDYFLLDTKKDE